jgi:hypothetical protein
MQKFVSVGAVARDESAIAVSKASGRQLAWSAGSPPRRR